MGNATSRQREEAGERLIQSVKDGDEEMRKDLWAPSDGKRESRLEATALWLAAGRGSASAVALLLPRCDPNAPLGSNGTTALMEAILNRRVDVVAMMLGASDAKSVDWDGQTALMHALRSGDRKMVEMLLPESDLGAVDRHGFSVANHARAYGMGDVACLSEARLLAKELDCGAAHPPARAKGSMSL